MASWDVVALGSRAMSKLPAVKDACEMSVRKWGSEGMVRIRASGLDKFAKAELVRHADAYMQLVRIFHRGFSIHIDAKC